MITYLKKTWDETKRTFEIEGRWGVNSEKASDDDLTEGCSFGYNLLLLFIKKELLLAEVY